MSSVSAVVFDFDGVILDSETPEFESHRLIFERCGATLTPDEWCDQIGVWVEGHHERWHARLCELAPEAPDWTSFEAERRRLFVSLVSREPMRGIDRLIGTLERAGIPLAIASTAPAAWVSGAAERLGIHHRFRTIVTCDDVERRKPAPDVYIEALRRLGADPARSIAIEDSGPGVASAKAAGLATVAIPHWLTERHDLSRADVRVSDASELTLALLENLVLK